MPQDLSICLPGCFATTLKEARIGSVEAVSLLIDSYRSYLLCIANQNLPGHLQSKAGGSDLVQDAILAAWKEFHRFRGDSEKEFAAWLREILHNTIRAFVRSYRDCKKRQIAQEQSVNDPKAANALVYFSSPCPITEISRTEDRLALYRAIATLPEPNQRAFLLHYDEHLTFGEVGSRLGISEEAARKLWVRALRQLGRSLNQLGIGIEEGS